MTISAAHDSEFWWIEKQTGCVLTPHARAIKATDAKGKTWGMVAYDCWTKNSAQAHMATLSPITWKYLARPAFRYPFEQCGVGILLGVIPSRNDASVRTAKHLGFTEAHRIKDGWAVGEDLVLIEMRKHDCRWLGGGKT